VLTTEVGRPTGWVVGAALTGSALLQWVGTDTRPSVVGTFVFMFLPIGLLAATATVLSAEGRMFAVGALFVACSASVMTSVAAGERHGAIAVAIACGGAVFPVLRRRDPGVAVAAVVILLIAGMVLWWGSGVSRGSAPAPSWGDIVETTGDDLRAGFGAVGVMGVPLPTGAYLAWWCAVGLVVGGGLLAGRVLAVASVPGAIIVFILVAWAVTAWRGPVDAAGGMWLVSGAVAFVGASTGLPSGADRRLGRVLVAVAGAVWAVAIVRLLREAGSSWPMWVSAVAVNLVIVVVMSSRVSSVPAGAAPVERAGRVPPASGGAAR
jgi:hypothetical protein